MRKTHVRLKGTDREEAAKAIKEARAKEPPTTWEALAAHYGLSVATVQRLAGVKKSSSVYKHKTIIPRRHHTRQTRSNAQKRAIVSEALAIKKDHPRWTWKRVARHVGVPSSTLSHLIHDVKPSTTHSPTNGALPPNILKRFHDFVQEVIPPAPPPRHVVEITFRYSDGEEETITVNQ